MRKSIVLFGLYCLIVSIGLLYGIYTGNVLNNRYSWSVIALFVFGGAGFVFTEWHSMRLRRRRLVQAPANESV